MNQSRVFIIAEAGSNWKVRSETDGLKRAYQLIEIAKKAGADAVKFQVFSGADVYVTNAGSSDYLAKLEVDFRPINDIFKEIAMPHHMVEKLAAYCGEIGIEFMASFFSKADFDVINEHVKCHKIASYEITHIRLLELAAKSKKPLILSTGASEIEDIEYAVNHFREFGGKEISLMQCTAKYPAGPEHLNLNVIPELRKKFGLPVGFSDHSMHPIVGPLAAVSLGASVIEKHFTQDRNLNGPDHAFAVEPNELKEMVEAIREYEAGNFLRLEQIKSTGDYKDALGSKDKTVFPVEMELRKYAQRGIQAIKDISKDELFKEGLNIGILRPGKQEKGLHPKNITKIEGKPARRSIRCGDGIQNGDF